MTQEIGSAVEHDKKTAKKQAATRAIDFLLKYTPSATLVPAPVAPPEGPATSSALGKCSLFTNWYILSDALTLP